MGPLCGAVEIVISRVQFVSYPTADICPAATAGIFPVSTIGIYPQPASVLCQQQIGVRAWFARGYFIPANTQHRVFRQGSSGAVRPYRLKLGFRRVSVGTPIWHDRTRRALTDDSMVSYHRCTTKIRTPTGRHSIPSGPQGTQRPPGGRPAVGAPRFRAS